MKTVLLDYKRQEREILHCQHKDTADFIPIIFWESIEKKDLTP